jgi:hypothetical protein
VASSFRQILYADISDIWQIILSASWWIDINFHLNLSLDLDISLSLSKVMRVTEGIGCKENINALIGEGCTGSE